MERKLKKILPILLLTAMVIYFYRNIFHGFFQQDEWFSYGYFLLNKNLDFSNFIKFIFAPNITHYNPITVFIEYILFYFWGMDYFNFITLGLLLHLITICSVYFLALKIFKGDKLLAFLSSLLFGIFAATYQGAAWVIVDIATVLSSILGILSTYFFITFLEKFKYKYFIFSMFLLLISLFVKEIAIGLFLFFLILLFFNSKKKQNLKYGVFIFGIGFLYFIFRVIMIFVSHKAGGNLATDSEPFKDLIYNFLSIPLKSLSQIIFPAEFIRNISENSAKLFPVKITGMFGSPDFENFVVKRIMEGISVTISILVLSFSSVFIFLRKNKNISYVIVFSLAWVLINSFIIGLSPGRSGLVTVVDSRNLYFLSVGVALFLVFIIKYFSKNNLVKTLILFVFLFVFNIYFLNKNLDSFTQNGSVRKVILDHVMSENPIFPKKVFFYTESDSSYYGLPETTHILPFQSGFGQTLLVWSERENNFPKEFFTNNFLWDIESEGYKEISGRGFGYFRNFEHLASFYAINNENEPVLIAYSFNSRDNSLKNITKEILGRIDGYRIKKRLLNTSGFTGTSAQNNSEIKNIFDKNIRSSWSSQLPYMNYQYILIDMKSNFTIAEIVIDSYNDQNQNGVGYRIDLSNDQKNWRTVFESRKYLPDSKGKDNLYFEPTNARFIKIEQIGYHKYAPWVIDELYIYEKN